MAFSQSSYELVVVNNSASGYRCINLVLLLCYVTSSCSYFLIFIFGLPINCCDKVVLLFESFLTVYALYLKVIYS